MRQLRGDRMNPVEIIRCILIWPLLKERPRNTTETDHLNAMLCVSERPICIYRALRDFELPGIPLEGAFHVPGLVVPRTVRRGVCIAVRKDSRIRWFDVELEGRVFKLTGKEWRSIQKRLRKGRKQDEL